MIEIVDASNIASYRDEMEQVYRLRHDVFVDEMGWTDIAKADRREIDQFDDEHAIHMIYRRDGAVAGYQRMLPTTRPHLLTEVLRDLCEVEPPSSPSIWEWTRYCVAKPVRERGRHLSPAANCLLSGIVEWGLESGVNQVLIEMDPMWVLRLVQLNFMVTPLGIPKQINNASTVAVLARFDRRTLNMLRDLRGSHAPVLAGSFAGLRTGT